MKMKYDDLKAYGSPEDIVLAFKNTSELIKKLKLLISIDPYISERLSDILSKSEVKFKTEMEGSYMNIDRLQGFQVRNVSIDTLVAVRADLKTLASNYTDLGVDMPAWIVSKLAEVEREIKNLTRAQKEAKLAKLKASRAGLMTADEKRKQLDADILAAEEELK